MPSKKIREKATEESVMEEPMTEEKSVTEETCIDPTAEVESNEELNQPVEETFESEPEQSVEEKPAKEKKSVPRTPKPVIEDVEIVKDGIKIIEKIGEVKYNLKDSNRVYRTTSPAKLRSDNKNFTVIKVW